MPKCSPDEAGCRNVKLSQRSRQALQEKIVAISAGAEGGGKMPQKGPPGGKNGQPLPFLSREGA